MNDQTPETKEPTGEPEGLEKLVTTLPVDHAGTTVYLKGWRRPDAKKPPIVIVHDLGEHTEHYRETAYRLVASEFSTYVFDLRGHGRSGRRLGHAPSFNILVKDLLQVAAWVRHKENGRAPIILGHGIGGLIVNEFTRRHAQFCKAAILSAPCLELAHDVTPMSKLVIRFLSEWLPTFRIPPSVGPKFARDFRHVHEETEDGTRLPYFPRLTAIFTQELLSAVQRAKAEFIEYPGSVLILCPGKDTVCTYAWVRKAAAVHDENNLQIADLPDAGHAVLTDDVATREAALAHILPWLEDVAAGRERRGPRLGRIEGASREDRPLEPRGHDAAAEDV